MTTARTSGFTLIEVLVAVAIFGILSIMAMQAIGRSLANADSLDERMNRVQGIQRSMSMLGRDLVQASPRPVRDAIGDGLIPAIRTNLGTEFALEVTRGGWPNPAGLPRSTLQRVAWRIEDGQLLRYHWNVLDPSFANEPIITELLDNVDSIVFRYRTHGGEWTEQWPPIGVQEGNSTRLRPQVVEVILTLPDEGELRRFFEVAP